MSIFSCLSCDLASVLLQCGHVVHVGDCPRTLHYGRCAYCSRLLEAVDKLGILQILQLVGYFDDGLETCPCPDNDHLPSDESPNDDGTDSPAGLDWIDEVLKSVLPADGTDDELMRSFSPEFWNSIECGNDRDGESSRD